MSETATKSVIEKLNLTEAEEAQRQAAKTWLKAAETAYTDELKALVEKNRKVSGSRAGRTAVAPHISSAPEHVKRGTQIDQEIWKAESAVEDDYEAERDYELYGPTLEQAAEENAWQHREDRASAIEDAFRGDGYSVGLEGEVALITSGEYKDGYGESFSLASTDELMRHVAPFAELQAARQEALGNDRPDPLAQQMRKQFNA